MTFVEREKLSSSELVMPAAYFDGESFPPKALNKQFMDFSEFTSTMPKFWETELAVTFEAKGLRRFAHDLADMIRKAPPYDDAFPIVEAPDDEVESEQKIARPADV